mgnify:CR=1 FL=1
MNNLENEALKSNFQYWKNENENDNKDILLYETFYATPQHCYGISKVALCAAKVLNLKPAVILPWKGSKMSKSMCGLSFQMKDKLMVLLIKHCFLLLRCFGVNNKKKLLGMSHKGINIGTYIYDSLLRSHCIPTITEISFSYRLRICSEMLYFLYFERILSKYPVKIVIIGDNVYRYGLLFELCKQRNIECVSPVDLNSMFMLHYRNLDDFKHSYVNKNIVDLVCNHINYEDILTQYYNNRYCGNLEQHDVLSAYSGKHVTEKDKFVEKYSLDSTKNTVVIMSHVFADAPHVYASIYDDYWEWFINTLKCLRQNKNINVLVKEHPSAYLYNEKGVIKKYLKDIGADYLLIDDNESTVSVLKSADVVVTCGGTIGLEFSSIGKPVVLASQPPYSELGFTHDFYDRKKYEEFLMGEIHTVKRLSEEQILMARKVSYLFFVQLNKRKENLEIGDEVIYLGHKYNNDSLFNSILKYNNIPLREQEVYKLIRDFINSSERFLLI